MGVETTVAEGMAWELATEYSFGDSHTAITGFRRDSVRRDVYAHRALCHRTPSPARGGLRSS